MAGAVLLVGLVLSGRAQQRPLVTEPVRILPTGWMRIDFGFEFLQRQQFPLSGVRGDLSRVGVVGLSVGVAPAVEIQIRGTIHNYLSIDERRDGAIPLRLPAPESTHDVGDLSVWTKMRLWSASPHGPMLGLRFGVELPVSDQARGIGTNQTNVFAAVLAEKRWRAFDLFGHLGVGILPAPLETFTQNDVMLYGVAGVYEMDERVHLVAEVNGWESTRRASPLGTESRGQARVGVRFRAAGLWWDVAGVRGLHAIDPRSGILFGASTALPLRRP